MTKQCCYEPVPCTPGQGCPDSCFDAYCSPAKAVPNSTVQVSKFPDCDLCKSRHALVEYYLVKPAGYDARTIIGSWAYLCEEHFKEFGIGLGLGKGQRLVLREVNNG